jgi:very-short-patch-repair endonuclease
MARGTGHNLSAEQVEKIQLELMGVVPLTSRGKRDTSGEDKFGEHVRQHRLPAFVHKFRLLKTLQLPRRDLKPIPREWEFDWCCVEYKLIVEVDGGIYMAGGGAHSHPVDIRRNMTKRNDAALAGFFVMCFTPQEVKSRFAIGEVERFMATRGWKR